MKNTIKMSLVAAVAVAGFSTTAAAGNLEDMIKDTTVSGKIEVGFNMKTTEKNGVETSTNEWEYDFDATLTTKVNDIISAQIGIQADHEVEPGENSTDYYDNNQNKNSNTGAQSITLTKLNIIAKTDYATAIIGKQTQPTPFLDDERGDGVVALVPAGPVTLAAGHFTGMVGGATQGDHTINVNLKDRDITALAAIAAVGPVNVQAWYLMASGAQTGLGVLGNANSNLVEQGLDGYSIMVDGTFGPVKVNAAHSSLELDAKSGSSFDAETLTKVVASFDAGVATVFGGFGMTNDASHNATGNALGHTRLHGVDLSGDDDAKTNFALELTKLDAVNDATAFLLGATAKMDALTVTGQYLMATAENHTAGEADTDVWEINLEASYAMSKNFTVSGLYAVQDIDADGTDDDTDTDSIQLSMLYKF